MMKRFLGVTREPVFSPGKVEDDTLILLETAAHLRDAGHDVELHAGECTWFPTPRPGAIVFTMAQGDKSLAQLQEWQAAGVRVLNSPEGILNCQRHRTVPLLTRSGVAFPESVIVTTGNGHDVPEWVREGAWVKRGDVHATQADDVTKMSSSEEARAALRRFSDRGVPLAVIQKHVPGVVVKFYAVRGRYFHALPSDGMTLSPETLRQIDAIGQRAAMRLNVEIYGGDAVVGTNGEVTLIDLNDWPSYSRCRADAARAIAEYIKDAHQELEPS